MQKGTHSGGLEGDLYDEVAKFTRRHDAFSWLADAGGSSELWLADANGDNALAGSAGRCVSWSADP